MNLLKEFSLNTQCSYLNQKEQTTHYKIIENIDAKECQEFIERGYRRFGKMYFRPICPTCHECQSIKIDVANFQLSKSQRRVLRKASKIKSYIQRPSVTQEHLSLFDKYHIYMHKHKGWEYQETTFGHYYSSFVSGHQEFGYEILYFYDEELIGVDLIDILPDGISSIYFFYDPDYREYALGKLSLLNQILYAKETKKQWIYLGYYVEGCSSLSYKSDYKPYVTLEGRPHIHENYSWHVK